MAALMLSMYYASTVRCYWKAGPPALSAALKIGALPKISLLGFILGCCCEIGTKVEIFSLYLEHISILSL